jgi:putative ABC transport system permease protein
MIGTSVDIAGDVPNLPDPDLLMGRTQLSSATGEQSPIVSLEYLYVPVSDFGDIPGIQSATLVAPSKIDMTINGTTNSGVMYAIDPSTFASVVADTWRSDYESQSLGEIINSMNVNINDAIISRRLANDLNINIGDRFEIVVDSLGSRRSISIVVANIISYMPTLYNEGPYFILTNYEHITNELGGKYMYELWLRSDGTDNVKAVQATAFRNSLRVLPYTPSAFVNAEILQPQRQGLFGLLSIGFVATGVMSMIGMLAYILLTLRKRSVEFGVLRAIGISQTSLRLTLALEQLITIGFSTLLGLSIGIITSVLYLPFLKVRQGVFPETPPFLVVFAGLDTGLIGLAATILMGLIIILELYVIQRMRIGEAVKLGEAV